MADKMSHTVPPPSWAHGKQTKKYIFLKKEMNRRQKRLDLQKKTAIVTSYIVHHKDEQVRVIGVRVHNMFVHLKTHRLYNVKTV